MSWEQPPMATTATATSPKRQRNGEQNSLNGDAHLDAATDRLNTNVRVNAVGILEVKMRHRLLGDPDAVAIGMTHSHGSTAAGTHGGKKAATRDRHVKKPHKLPKLHANASPSASSLAPLDDSRPTSFETERDQVMSSLQLPSPTRSLVNKHVQHTKDSHVKSQAALPPVSGIFKTRPAATSLFPLAYQRNELPIMVEPKPGGKTLRWTQDIGELDYSKYFPLFIEGMREQEYPFSFLAREGTFQLVAFGRDHPERVADALHRVVPALRANLETRDAGALLRDTLEILQRLASIPGIGLMLVPYYRQLLPVLNLFKSRRRNLGDAMDFKQQRAKDVGEIILETLELLERTGGPDAFVNIKYMVPTYEGCR